MMPTTKIILFLAAIFSVLTLAVGYLLVSMAARHEWHDVYASAMIIPFALTAGLWLGIRPRHRYKNGRSKQRPYGKPL